ncbi:hypothetical protein Tco_0939754 [Tanacetum coccineum]|uniref:Retrotransposon gag domain-containing protein n=1 Tax=Tanacetum coccineum TaxID=301880 RepID=A0ABQ5DLQ1_9ASTR
MQSINSRNYGRNTRRSFVQEEMIEVNNVQNDAGNTQRTLRTTSSGSAANVQCYNCIEKGHYARNYQKQRVRDSKYFMEHMLLAKQDEAGELSANICLMARIQPTNIDSNKGLSYDSSFLSEVQTSSTSNVNSLSANDNQEQKYLKKPKIIHDMFGDDQINSNIIFDEPNVDANNDSVEYDNNIQESYELEHLARNAYKEAKKQQLIAKNVQPQNTVLTKQLESYKEKHFKTLSLGESRSPDFDLFSDQEEYSKEEVAETMAETMEQYMSKNRADYGSRIARPKIVDLFHIPNITIDQMMLRAFPMSLTGAVNHWLTNTPSGLITTWEDMKIKFLRKYCPLARTTKKMEEINNF